MIGYSIIVPKIVVAQKQVFRVLQSRVLTPFLPAGAP